MWVYNAKGEGITPSPLFVLRVGAKPCVPSLPLISSERNGDYSPPPFVYSIFFDTDLPCMKSSM